MCCAAALSSMRWNRPAAASVPSRSRSGRRARATSWRCCCAMPSTTAACSVALTVAGNWSTRASARPRRLSGKSCSEVTPSTSRLSIPWAVSAVICRRCWMAARPSTPCSRAKPAAPAWRAWCWVRQGSSTCSAVLAKPWPRAWRSCRPASACGCWNSALVALRLPSCCTLVWISIASIMPTASPSPSLSSACVTIARRWRYLVWSNWPKPVRSTGSWCLPTSAPLVPWVTPCAWPVAGSTRTASWRCLGSTRRAGPISSSVPSQIGGWPARSRRCRASKARRSGAMSCSDMA
ncbi:hypothetical protein D9M71_377490 [compost metagenome]